MATMTDNIVNLLDANGITFLPYDEGMSAPGYDNGSIEWMECYERENIEEKTGYGAKMTADVDHGGISITSILNNEFILFEEDDEDGFIEQVQVVLLNFYRDL